MAKIIIDTDLLRKGLAKYYDEYKEKFHSTGDRYYFGLADGLDVAERVVDSLQQEQPSEDLEEEIQRYLREECSSDDEPTIGEIARHFAEWQKSKMLKEAVEGLICATITGTDAISFLSPLPKELTAGDKVKIMIMKED